VNHETRNPFSGLFEKLCQRAFKAVFLILLANTGLTATHAQIQFPVGLPESKAGEITKYRTIDLWNNNELSSRTSEIVEVTSDQFVSRGKTSTAAAPSTVYNSREWHPCRSMRDSKDKVCTGAFKFPMQVGNKHTYDKLPWANGAGTHTGTCEVKGEEKLTVTAGSFDTVRIECSGFWNRVFDGFGSGRINEVLWYAPSISRLVKSQFSDTFTNGQLNTKSQTELVEFTAGK
jgi:hypothetical protein